MFFFCLVYINLAAIKDTETNKIDKKVVDVFFQTRYKEFLAVGGGLALVLLILTSD